MELRNLKSGKLFKLMDGPYYHLDWIWKIRPNKTVSGNYVAYKANNQKVTIVLNPSQLVKPHK